MARPRPSWLETALAHQAASRFDEAVRIYQRALQANPNEPDALNLLGLVAAARGQYDVAAGLVRRAVALAPGRGDFLAALGNIAFARGADKERAEAYTRALCLLPFRTLPVLFAELAAHAGRAPVASDFDGVEHYRSQSSQDVYLDRWVFSRLRGGVFMDIGAHDGVSFSNSYAFEAARGWTGLCIEPNPSVFERLRANRRSTALNCCVAAKAGLVPFQKITGYSEMLSGIVHAYHSDHRARIARELAERGGVSETVEVAARTFADIAGEHAVFEIHYLNIDTEGSEMDILSSIPFGRVFVHAATVECNYEAERGPMVALMDKAGFDLAITLGHDLVFINRSSPFHGTHAAAFGR